MFVKFSKDISFYTLRRKWIWELNEDNIVSISRMKIRAIEKKYKDNANLFDEFKYLVFWRWVKKNTDISERFVNNFKKIINKLGLSLSPKEEKFITNIEEYVFSSWRPLKSIPVRFNLFPKEEVNLYQSKVFLLRWDDIDCKSYELGEYDLYYSNLRLIFCDKSYTIQREIYNNQIKDIDILIIGTIVYLHNGKNYLLRSNNKLLSYIFLLDIMPQFRDKNKKPDYYKLYSLSDAFFNIIN
ncbi:hypothetical protein [Spiroplasma endosymbiont of Aspidapion aeneum]|uniref:hypothetical protein n=1 Tax=Spiroplasma endosymbiont of Aspidapion aeneum TaxID=3066276 RepID=UPI00313DA190